MAYETRTKDDPQDVGRSIDQNQSIDNETALFDGVYGRDSAPGMVKRFVKLTGIVDNVAAEVFKITTVNEAGDNDGGTYMCVFEGISVHYGGIAGDNAVVGGKYAFSRAMKSTGVGQSTAVVEDFETAAAESEGGATKGISAVTCTVVETSEYEISVKFQVNLDGTAVATAQVSGMVTVYYDTFTTPPVITSAG